MSFFDDPANYASTDEGPRQRVNNRRREERLAAEDAAREEAAASKAEVIEKAITVAGLFAAALTARWQCVRAFRALGYSKRDARVLTTGLSGAAWAISVAVKQGQRFFDQTQEMNK